MKPRIEVKQKAIALRKKGFTYREIMNVLPVGKATLSGWLKYIDYSKSEIDRINKMANKNMLKGRFNASIKNRERRIDRENKVFLEAKKYFRKNVQNPLFLIGIALYWAEGSKRTGEFQFINSDPDMIKFMVFWIENFMQISKSDIKYRLYMHKIYNYEHCEDFWADYLMINRDDFEKTIYKPSKHKVKKNPKYKGCLRLSCGGIDALRRIKTFQIELIGYYCKYMRS